MQDKLLKIINHYGVMKQLKYIHTEYFELDEAIMDYENGTFLSNLDYEEQLETYKDHITEEIADIYVMLNQFQEYYDITDERIAKIMTYKIDRQIERIENE